MIELLVVVAIIGILASMLLPALGRAKAAARGSACRSNLRQMGLAWEIYLGDHDDLFPDRRDLKSSLPGGYKPWSTWPKSDPRSAWAAVVMSNALATPALWSCPSLAARPVLEVEPTRQVSTTNGMPVRYWMWRFDRVDDPVALDNFWAKRPEKALQDLREAQNPAAGMPENLGEVEFIVDVYFPGSAPGVDPSVAGLAAHPKGKNRAWLDGHVSWSRDDRLR